MDINTQTLKNTLNKLLDIQPHATRELNDKGFSGLFSELYGNCVKYNATAKEWYVWNGKVWESDVGGLKTLHLVKDYLGGKLMIEPRYIREWIISNTRTGTQKTTPTPAKKKPRMKKIPGMTEDGLIPYRHSRKGA